MTYIEQFWRDATAADVVRVMNGETMESRFRDADRQDWHTGDFCCFASRGRLQWVRRGVVFRYCQVYDPPQWYINKPEPGDEYRLLGKFPNEATQPGDEVRLDSGRWVLSHSAENSKPQQTNAWYRRRIEQPKPEPKHYTLQVGDTADTGNGFRLVVTEHGVKVT